MRSNFSFHHLSLIKVFTFFSLIFSHLHANNWQEEPEEREFDIYIKAIYLQAVSNKLNYAVEAFATPLPSPDWRIYDLQTGYHPAFEVAATGTFRHGKIMVDWEHFQSEDKDSVKVSSNSYMVGPLFEIGPDGSIFKSVHGKVKFNLDTINLNFYAPFKINSSLELSVYGGIGYVDLSQMTSSYYANNKETITRTVRVPTSFWGIGPQTGLAINYHITDSFSFTGRGKAALFVGNLKSHTKFTTVSPTQKKLDIPDPNIQTTKTDNRTDVVPGFKAQLGLNYSWMLSCNFSVEIEAGYQIEVYLDAIQSDDLSSEVITPPILPNTVGVYARTFRRTVSNFALSGPYLSVHASF